MMGDNGWRTPCYTSPHPLKSHAWTCLEWVLKTACTVLSLKIATILIWDHGSGLFSLLRRRAAFDIDLPG